MASGAKLATNTSSYFYCYVTPPMSSESETSPPPYFASTPDLQIPIPRTDYKLPLTWDHVKAIQRLARFFARLYEQAQESEDKSSLGKYERWMITLFQMDASIRDGTFLFLWLTRLTIELVSRNRPEEIAYFITFHELGEDSMEALEEANTLITPLMNYIRECKSIYRVMFRSSN